MKTPIVILASGRGSNFRAIVEACRAGRLDAEIRALITDQPQAGAIAIAREAGIAVEVVAWPSREAHPGLGVEERRMLHDRVLLEVVRRLDPRFIVLAGYRRVMTRPLIEAFRSERGYSRIINIHPSLLPAFPGLDSYGQAFRHGVKVTGVSIHLVEEVVDSGPICAQEAFSIADCREVFDVEKRGLEIEHRLYPETLSWVLPERFEVLKIQGRLHVRPN